MSEISEELRELIRAEIARQLASMNARSVRSDNVQSDNVQFDNVHSDNVQSDSTHSDNTRALTRAETHELVAAVGQQICDTVYDQLVSEINEKLVPKINNMVQWVNHNIQDGDAVVTDYRRAAESQARAGNLLPSTARDDRVISENVRLVFSEELD